MSTNPLVVVPARFSASASAHRYQALSTARTLSEGVLLAGGEPLAIHPWVLDGDLTSGDLEDRLGFADGVLLPGGGDLAPQTYGETATSDDVYDVDEVQDVFDLAVARWAIESGRPPTSPLNSVSR